MRASLFLAAGALLWWIVRPSADEVGNARVELTAWDGSCSRDCPETLHPHPPSLDFGELDPRFPAAGTLVLVNGANRPISVLSVASTCRCTVVESQASSVAPGQRRTIPVVFHPLSSNTTERSLLEIRTDDPACPTLRIPVVASKRQSQLPPSVTVVPSTLDVAQDDLPLVVPISVTNPSLRTVAVTVKGMTGGPLAVMASAPQFAITPLGKETVHLRLQADDTRDIAGSVGHVRVRVEGGEPVDLPVRVVRPQPTPSLPGSVILVRNGERYLFEPSTAPSSLSGDGPGTRGTPPTGRVTHIGTESCLSSPPHSTLDVSRYPHPPIVGVEAEGPPTLHFGRCEQRETRVLHLVNLSDTAVAIDDIREVSTTRSFTVAVDRREIAAWGSVAITAEFRPSGDLPVGQTSVWRVRFGRGSPLLLRLAGHPGSHSAGETSRLRVIALGGESGRLEPCNCETGQHGGLSRAVSLLKRVRAKSGATVSLHCGNSAGGDELTRARKARLAFDAFAFAELDAYVPGAQELSVPSSDLLDAVKASGIRVTAANVVDLTSRKPLFASKVVVDRDGVRCVIVGLVSMEHAGLASLVGAGYDLSDEVAALEEAIADVGPTDIVIVCGSLSAALVRRIHRECARADLLVMHGTIVDSAAIGRQTLLRVPPAQRGVVVWEGRIGVGTLGAVEERRALLELDGSVARNERVSALVRAYKRAWAVIEVPLRPDRGSAPRFVGSQACAECHRSATHSWAQSGHAHALRTLVAGGDEFDPDCLACHVVGHRRPSGYSTQPSGSGLDAVGCEACHGPGEAHVANVAIPPGRATACRECHTEETSPRFDESQYWGRIAHR